MMLLRSQSHISTLSVLSGCLLHDFYTILICI